MEAWPLDQLPQFMTRLPVIDFMKVDGEGVEPEILAGGMRTLRRTRVIAVDVARHRQTAEPQGARRSRFWNRSSFQSLPHDRSDTILALNTAMVGPFSSRVAGRRGS